MVILVSSDRKRKNTITYINPELSLAHYPRGVVIGSSTFKASTFHTLDIGCETDWVQDVWSIVGGIS